MAKRLMMALLAGTFAAAPASAPSLAEPSPEPPEAASDELGYDAAITDRTGMAKTADVARDVVIYAILWLGSRLLQPGPYGELLMALRQPEEDGDGDSLGQARAGGRSLRCSGAG